MEPLTDKQLTIKAAAFFKAKGNGDIDSVFMTDDGQIFLKENKSYATGHSHGTESGNVYEFFRSKVFTKLSNGTQEVDNTEQESEVPEKKLSKKEQKAADQAAKEAEKTAKVEVEAEAEAKEKAEEKKDEESFEDQVKRIGDLNPEEREKELSTYKDGEDKDALVEAIAEYIKDNQPPKASDLPEKFQKPLSEMTEDELINLAVHLGSDKSEPTLRKSSMEEITAHCEDLAAKSKTELIK